MTLTLDIASVERCAMPLLCPYWSQSSVQCRAADNEVHVHCEAQEKRRINCREEAIKRANRIKGKKKSLAGGVA